MSTAFELRCRPPFHWPALRARLAAWDAAGHDLEVHGEAVRLALPVPGGAAVATVRAAGDANDPRLAVELTRGSEASTGARTDADASGDADANADADARAAAAWLRTAWGLDDDLAPLRLAAEDDPPFAPIEARLRGARLVRHGSPFEAACWALIRQRTPHAFAVRSLRRLRDLAGPEVRAHGRAWRAFPSAAALAGDDARPALLAATNNVRKVERLHAAAVALSALDDAWLRTAPLGEARRALARVHGAGPWTVDYVLAIGVGRLDHVPWTDTGLAQAVADVYAGGLRLDRATMRGLARRYGSLAGVWAHWLKRARAGWRGY